jgi:UDP-GlcNAc:undecaprenyl-phosphate GlcNAc-1-phosphate transferase
VAASAVWLGIDIVSLNDPFGPGRISLGWPLAVGFSIFWIVGMINSINFIDGLDGLSSGIGLIAAVTLGLISLTDAGGPFGQPLVAAMCFTLAGALFGFLRWNFHPASVFAGTSGTMFVGYVLVVLSVLGTAKIAVALLVLGVPFIDAFWIIIRRVVNRRLPFSPDRGHIHHRLLDLGLTHMQTVLLIYLICAGLALLSFVLSGTGQLYAFMGLVVVFGLGLFALARGETSDALEADAYEEPR